MQTLLCVIYFIFTIISDGSFNGWTVLKKVQKCKEDTSAKSAYGFVTFFTICENLLYYLGILLGLYTVNRIRNPVYEHPFEEIELADNKAQNMGTDVEIS